MATSIDLAREMARHFQAGKGIDETLAEVRAKFPTATLAELMHACLGASGVRHVRQGDLRMEAQDWDPGGHRRRQTSCRSDCRGAGQAAGQPY